MSIFVQLFPYLKLTIHQKFLNYMMLPLELNPEVLQNQIGGPQVRRAQTQKEPFWWSVFSLRRCDKGSGWHGEIMLFSIMKDKKQNFNINIAVKKDEKCKDELVKCEKG